MTFRKSWRGPLGASLLFSTLLPTALLLGGCGNPNAIPAHTGDEDKLVNQIKNETPEQQIDRIQKGPMPDSAKAAMIQKIKSEHGIK